MLTSVIICCSTFTTTADEDYLFSFKSEDDMVFELLHKIGDFLSIRTTYYETKMKNKLRFDTSYIKSTLAFENLGIKIPITQVQDIARQKLLQCDQLSL